MPDTDHLLSDAYLADIGTRPIEDVRAMRARCVEVETGLSYLRRLVHGSIDILRGEQDRRSSGAPSAAADLVAALPDLLGDAPRPAGIGRLASTLEPVELDPGFHAEFQALIGDGRLSGIDELGDEQLAELAVGLDDLERRLSARRSAFFRQIDALQAELIRRYRSGEASVEQLLLDPS